MLAPVDGFHRQRDDPLQRGLGISFGDEDPGDRTELLRQLNVAGVCHSPTLVPVGSRRPRAAYVRTAGWMAASGGAGRRTLSREMPRLS